MSSEINESSSDELIDIGKFLSERISAPPFGFIEPKFDCPSTYPIYRPYYYLRSSRLLYRSAAVLVGRFV